MTTVTLARFSLRWEDEPDASEEVIHAKDQRSPAVEIRPRSGSARSCGIGKTTVAECLARFERAGLSWPQALELDDASLEQRLYPPPPTVAEAERPEPVWSHSCAARA